MRLAGVAAVANDQQKGAGSNHADRGELLQVGAGDKEHDRRRRHDQDGGADLRLQHDQHGDDAHQHAEGQQPRARVANPPPFAGKPGAHVDDDSDLRRLAGLDAALVIGARGAKAFGAEEDHGQQRQKCDTHERDAPAIPEGVGDARSHDQPRDPDYQPHDLAKDKVVGVVEAFDAAWIAGAEDHYDAQHEQDRHHGE
jgi:hypothetical protein